MWLKRTPEKVADVKRKQRLERIRISVVVGLLMTLMISLLFGWGEAYYRGRIFVPLDEIVNRLPFSLLVGLIAGVVCFLPGPRKRTVVCPKCDTTKYVDGSLDCSCGGHFEDMDEMKWV